MFFIPTDLIQSPRLTWWDHIAYAIKNTQKTTLTLDYPVRLSIDLQSRKRIDVIRRIHAAYKSGHAIDASAFFDQLDSRLAVRVDPVSLGRGLFMSWEQIRLLRRAGMGLRAHTHTHPVLSRLAEPDQWSEARRIKTDPRVGAGRGGHGTGLPCRQLRFLYQRDEEIGRDGRVSRCFFLLWGHQPAGPIRPLRNPARVRGRGLIPVPSPRNKLLHDWKRNAVILLIYVHLIHAWRSRSVVGSASSKGLRAFYITTLTRTGRGMHPSARLTEKRCCRPAKSSVSGYAADSASHCVRRGTPSTAGRTIPANRVFTPELRLNGMVGDGG